MKRLMVVLAAFCVASVYFASAQTHYITMSGQLGEHSWLGDLKIDDPIKNRFGVGGGIGVGYEFQYKHFILAAGVHANITRSGFLTDWTTDGFYLKDNTGVFNFKVPNNAVANVFAKENAGKEILDKYIEDNPQAFDTYYYLFKERHDDYVHVTVQPYLMIGGQWNHFYALAGVKYETSSLWERTYSSVIVNSQGHNDNAYFKDIYANSNSASTNPPFCLELDGNGNPVKGYYSIDPNLPIYDDESPLYDHSRSYDDDMKKVSPTRRDTGNFVFNWNLLASVELGWTSGTQIRVDKKTKKTMRYQYRIGAYADFGCMPYSYTDSTKMAFTHPVYEGIYNGNQQVGMVTPMHEVDLNDLLQSNYGGTNIRPLQVGVKFTVLFQLPKIPPCVICKDNHPKPFTHNHNHGNVVIDKKKQKR